MTGRVGNAVQIPQEQILELLKSRGRGNQVAQAEGEVPIRSTPTTTAVCSPSSASTPTSSWANLGDLGSRFGLSTRDPVVVVRAQGMPAPPLRKLRHENDRHEGVEPVSTLLRLSKQMHKLSDRPRFVDLLARRTET